MKIIIRKGKVIRFDDTGSVSDHLANLDALTKALQQHAASMQKVASRALGADPAEAYESMRREPRSSADRQERSAARVSSQK